MVFEISNSNHLHDAQKIARDLFWSHYEKVCLQFESKSHKEIIELMNHLIRRYIKMLEGFNTPLNKFHIFGISVIVNPYIARDYKK